ncbi:MAG: efflux RND transporter periplasmic adaptor subunit [Myxococcales bacterium]
MRFLRLPLGLAGAVSLAWAAAGGGCRRGPADGVEVPAGPKRVHCGTLVARQVSDTIELHGTVAPLPDRDAQIAPQVAGRILHVLVREGDRVQRGQPLAHIDPAGLADQAQQAGAQLAKAQAETRLAGVSRTRVGRVFERGIAARQELDDAEARLATAQASEADARAASHIANRQLERATVRSPLAGVVLKLFRKSGELVDGTPTTPLVEVGDPSQLELVAPATAADLVQARPGQAAAIEVPALPSVHLRGAVAAVSPAVDRATGLGVVRVAIDASGGTTPPVGVTGTTRIDVGRQRSALAAPAAALRAASGDNAEMVVCGDDARAHVVKVRKRAESGGLVELDATPDAKAGAARAGLRVAVDPVLGLEEGDPIERVP